MFDPKIEHAYVQMGMARVWFKSTGDTLILFALFLLQRNFSSVVCENFADIECSSLFKNLFKIMIKYFYSAFLGLKVAPIRRIPRSILACKISPSFIQCIFLLNDVHLTLNMPVFFCFTSIRTKMSRFLNLISSKQGVSFKKIGTKVALLFLIDLYRKNLTRK